MANGNLIFKTLLLKGAKGDPGQNTTIPQYSVIGYDGDDIPEGYEEVNDPSVIKDMYNILGAKNLIPYPYYETTKTSNGVTFTDNGD